MTLRGLMKGMRVRQISMSSQQPRELLNGELSMAEEAAQQAGIEDLMIRYRHGRLHSEFDQNDVAGGLAGHRPAGALEGVDRLAARTISGQLGHQTAMATTSTKKFV